MNKIPKNIRFDPDSLKQIEELVEWGVVKDRTHAIEMAVKQFHRQTRQGKQGPDQPSFSAEVSKYLGEAIAATQGNVLHLIEPGVKDNIVELDLSGKNLAMLPPEIMQLRYLQRLDLSFNQLTTLPPELGTLSELQKLYLNDNQLTELPAEIGQLNSLMRLHIYNNELESLPATLGQLENLLSMYAHRNRLAEIPPELGKLKNLQWLDLSHNQLTRLPAELKRLSQLTRFHVNGNPLSLSPNIISQGPQAILEAIPPDIYQIIITGVFSAGKTQFIETIGDVLMGDAQNPIRSVKIEKKLDINPLTLSKESSTIPLDYGHIKVDTSLLLYLFGTPGVWRFTPEIFLEDLETGKILGFIVVLDSYDSETFEEARHSLEIFYQDSKLIPYVVIATQQDKPDALTYEQMQAELQLDFPVNILPCVTTDKESVKGVILELLSQQQSLDNDKFVRICEKIQTM